MPEEQEQASGDGQIVLESPPDNATVMESIAAGPEDLRKKIVELTKQLTEVEGLKKSADKGFNDQIKDIKTDIKMTLDLLKQQESANG